MHSTWKFGVNDRAKGMRRAFFNMGNRVSLSLVLWSIQVLQKWHLVWSVPVCLKRGTINSVLTLPWLMWVGHCSRFEVSRVVLLFAEAVDYAEAKARAHNHRSGLCRVRDLRCCFSFSIDNHTFAVLYFGFLPALHNRVCVCVRGWSEGGRNAFPCCPSMRCCSEHHTRGVRNIWLRNDVRLRTFDTAKLRGKQGNRVFGSLASHRKGVEL